MSKRKNNPCVGEPACVYVQRTIIQRQRNLSRQRIFSKGNNIFQRERKRIGTLVFSRSVYRAGQRIILQFARTCFQPNWIIVATTLSRSKPVTNVTSLQLYLNEISHKINHLLDYISILLIIFHSFLFLSKILLKRMTYCSNFISQKSTDSFFFKLFIMIHRTAVNYLPFPINRSCS